MGEYAIITPPYYYISIRKARKNASKSGGPASSCGVESVSHGLPLESAFFAVMPTKMKDSPCKSPFRGVSNISILSFSEIDKNP